MTAAQLAAAIRAAQREVPALFREVAALRKLDAAAARYEASRDARHA